MLSGGAIMMLLFGIIGQVMCSGIYVTCDNYKSSYVNFPGRYGSYWQLSVGMVMGVFTLVCFVVYFVLKILDKFNIISKTIALVGAVLWLSALIAECCSIRWSGIASVAPTSKAIADNEMSIFINTDELADYSFIFHDVSPCEFVFVLKTGT